MRRVDLQGVAIVAIASSFLLAALRTVARSR